MLWELLLNETESLRAAYPAGRRRRRAPPPYSTLADWSSSPGNSGGGDGTGGGGGVLKRGYPDSSTISRSTSAVPPQME